jgi:hypothetical protein
MLGRRDWFACLTSCIHLLELRMLAQLASNSSHKLNPDQNPSMKHSSFSMLVACALAATPAIAEQWTNALGNNDFTNWANWVLDGTADNPASWAAASQNWQVNLAGPDKAILGPGQSATGLDRNVLVGDAESSPVGSTGELLIDGGMLGINRSMRIGRDTVTGYGTVTVDGGGTVDIGYGLYLGQSANAGSTFELIDGTVDVTTASGRSDGLLVAHRAEGNGTLDISGGQLRVKAGNAVFSDGGNEGASTSALDISGGGALYVENGYISFGGNAGGVTVTAGISGDGYLSASNGRFGFGADSSVVFALSGGMLDIPNSFVTFGQGAGATVSVTITGGVINTDRMAFANNAEATTTLVMTSGTINVVRSGTSTATTSGAFRMGAGVSDLGISGDAVVNTEKLWIAAGGLLTLGGEARINVTGSTDETNRTFDFNEEELAGGLVLGKIALNGGSIQVAGAADPVTAVDYVDLLTAAIAAGVIYTDVEDADLVVEYDAGGDLTRLFLASEPVPEVNPWEDLEALQGFKPAGIGWIMDDHYPYIFHASAGWLWIVAQGASLDAFYGYDFAGEYWFWSRDNLGGWRYDFNSSEWRQQ